MTDRTPPERRSPAAGALDRSLLATLTEMFNDNETITARAAVRRMSGADHASTLTRDPWRAAVIEDFKSEQAHLRRMMEKSDKTSKTNLAAALVREKARVVALEEKIALLTASHHALILAVGEMGGIRSWVRFFEGYRSAIDGLRELGALPSATVVPLPARGARNEEE